MCSILEDKEKSKELIRLGKQNVKRFSWEKTAEQYEDVLRTVVFNGV
jgi:glycosyltransferase involved in cell wall biosynthesis